MMIRLLITAMMLTGCGACRESGPASAADGGASIGDDRAKIVADKPPASTVKGPESAPGSAAAAFDHGSWNEVLGKFVDDRGLVNYAGIAESAAFREYLKRLADFNAAALKDDGVRLAFWINAYNALTIRAVLRTLGGDRAKWSEYSILDQKIDGQSLWKGMSFDVGGGRWTLDAIEHEILRKRDGLRDPRIHVALVCAAGSCPPLWNRAYLGREVKEQLAAAMRRFVSDPRQCAIDGKKRTIRISRVFDWYAADFTDPRFSPRAESIPAFLARSVDDAALARSLRTGDWRVEYFEYNWKLNLQR